MDEGVESGSEQAVCLCDTAVAPLTDFCCLFLLLCSPLCSTLRGAASLLKGVVVKTPSWAK